MGLKVVFFDDGASPNLFDQFIFGYDFSASFDQNPQNIEGASIENTGNTDLVFLEMFKADQYLDFSMNNWIRRLPPEMVTAHLNIDEATIRKIPAEKRVVIAG